MALRYSVTMRSRQTLPRLWLISDARNDAGLDVALRRLPRGSGLVFRHYHLSPAERLARFRALSRLCRACGHVIVLAGPLRAAQRWNAHGSYGLPAAGAGLRLATVHDLREIGQANRSKSALALLSPVFPTRSHPGSATLGPVRFRLMARRAAMPVLALGGLNRKTARRLPGFGWAAIDGLSGAAGRTRSVGGG